MDRQKQYNRQLAKNLPRYAEAADRTYYWSMANQRNPSVMKLTTAYVTAPVIFAYVEWILADAVHRRLKRLYFLSRDGYQMLEAAKIIQRKHHYKLELCYLYCSRYALQIPSNRLKDDFVEGICTGGKEVRLEQVLQRGGLTREEIDVVIQSLSEFEQKEQILSYQHIRKLKDSLNQNIYFRQCVLQHSEEAYDACIGYLKQEGLFDKQPYAIVDSGWTGRMQAMLQEILDSVGYEYKIQGYYFGLYELPSNISREWYHAFYFCEHGDYRRKVWFNNNLFEVIFSAPEGMTTGYQKNGDRFLPVYADRTTDSWFYEEQQRLIQRFANEMHITVWNVQNPEQLRKKLSCGIAPVIKEFMTCPTVEEVQYYGTMQFSDHVLEEGKTQLAESLGRKEFRANHVFSRLLRMQSGECVPTSFWLMGSLKRYKANRLELAWHRIWILAYYYALYIKKDLDRKT